MKEAIECIAETFTPYAYIINKKKTKEKNNMFKFNKIVKPDSDMMKLAKEVEKVKAKNEELQDEIEVLKRIVKYAKDGQATFNFMEKIECINVFLGCKRIPVIYIYVDGEEYIIELESLPPFANKDSFDFSVSDNLAYFDVSVMNCKEEFTRYNFIIDYKKGTYVYSTRPDVERTEANKAIKKED